jgi:membrane protein DedA with SNARE-associated domain
MEDLIREWGYIVLFLYSFGGGFVALAVAGVLSFSGDMNLYISMIVAGVANFLGDQFLFYLTIFNKDLTDGILKNYRRKIAYTKLLLKKYGSIAIFIQKYIYGVKTLIPIVIGLAKYDAKKFIIFNFLATIVWAVVVGYVSFTLGEVLLTLNDEYKYYIIGFVVAVILGVSQFMKRI